MATSSNTQYPVSNTAVRTTIQNGGGISSTTTSFDVGIVKNIPSTPFLISVFEDQAPLREDDMEVMEVTSTSGTTLTVNRGQKGTTAQSFSDGDLVFMAISTPDVFDEIIAKSGDIKTYSIGDNSHVTFTPKFSQAKLNVIWQSGNLSMDQVGAVLLLDTTNGNSTVIGKSESTQIKNGAYTGTTGENGFFTVGVKSDGTVDLENRTGNSVTISVSSRK